MSKQIAIDLIINDQQFKAVIQNSDQLIEGLRNDAKSVGEGLSNWGNVLTGFNQGLELAKKAFAFISEPIKEAGQFEQYNTSLTVMLHSADAAKERLSELVEFAAKTPFQLPEVIDAANKIQAIGRYSEETLTSLGDLASASGKPFEQATNAFAKLASGQKGIAVDMFRDLLITTEDWSKATGKKIGKNGELQASVEEMVAALPKIIKEKGFAGMMDEQSKTFNGMASNFEDSISKMKTAVGTALLPMAKSAVDSMMNIVTALTPVKSNFDEATEKAFQQRFAFEKLVVEYEDLRSKTNKTKEEQDRYNSVMDELHKKYPDHLKDLDLQTGSLTNVHDAFEKVRGDIETQIRLELKLAQAKDLIKRQEDAHAEEDAARAKKMVAETNQKIANQKPGTVNITPGLDPSSSAKSYKEGLQETIDAANNAIRIAQAEAHALQLQIDEILKGANKTASDLSNKGDSGTNKPPKPSTPTSAEDKVTEYLKKQASERERMDAEEILKAQMKGLTLSQLNKMRIEELEKGQAIEQQIRANSSKDELDSLILKKENSDKLVEMINHEVDKQTEAGEKLQSDKKKTADEYRLANEKEILSDQLKFYATDTLNQRIAESIAQRAALESEVQSAKDEQRLQEIQKERTALDEKIQMMQEEVDTRVDFQVQQDELNLQNQNSLDARVEQERIAKLRVSELNEEELTTKKRLAVIEDELSRTQLTNKRKALLDEQKIKLDQLKSLDEAKKNVLQHNEEMIASGQNYYDAQKSFVSNAGNMTRQIIKQELSKAVAKELASVIEVIPFPFNLIAAPLAGLAVTSLFESIVPKFETGTPSFGGGFALLGERGVELAELPAGTTIYNHSQTDNILNSPNMSGFQYLADVIENQTRRLESVERVISLKVRDFDEAYQDYKYLNGKVS